MKKEETIKRYGKAAYKKVLQQNRDWNALWREANPNKLKAKNQEIHRKGGKYYNKHLDYNTTGIQGDRTYIRRKHTKLYHDSKEATPNSQIHHEWIPGTADFRGVALVEKGAHRYGIIKVIKILEGKITLLTEREIRNQGYKI